MLTSSPYEPDNIWLFKPRGEPGDWERCDCSCHSSPGRAVHFMACCDGGWKKTFQLRAKEMAEHDRKARESLIRSTTYRPVHGGYPNATR